MYYVYNCVTTVIEAFITTVWCQEVSK